ncbi:MAG: hypothetical protein WD794_09945 [Mycobacteriales bacterium]
MTTAAAAQGWALLGILGVLATGILALVALSQANLKAFVAAKFEAVDARFDTVDARFDAVDQRFAGVDQRFDAMDRRLEALDRDVQVLSDRVFRDRP